jgi:hypothetical protein
MSLSLPLPSAGASGGGGGGRGRLRPLRVTVVPWDVSSGGPASGQPRRVELKVPVAGTVADLRRACLEKVCERERDVGKFIAPEGYIS